MFDTIFTLNIYFTYKKYIYIDYFIYTKIICIIYIYLKGIESERKKMMATPHPLVNPHILSAARLG